MCNKKINLLVVSLFVSSCLICSCGDDKPKSSVSDDEDETQVVYEIDNSNNNTCTTKMYNSSSECLSDSAVKDLLNSCEAIISDGNRLNQNRYFRQSNRISYSSNYDPEEVLNDGNGKSATLYTICQNYLSDNNNSTNNTNTYSNNYRNYPYQHANNFGRYGNGINRGTNGFDQNHNFGRRMNDSTDDNNAYDQNSFDNRFPGQRFSNNNGLNLNSFNNQQDWMSLLSNLRGSFTNLTNGLGNRWNR